MNSGGEEEAQAFLPSAGAGQMILVTGGAGYVGSLLVTELLALGQFVRVVDTLWFGNPFSAHERLEVLNGDLCAGDPAWLDGVEAVVHLAGLSNDPTADFAPNLNIKSNLVATRWIATEVAKKATKDDRPIRCIFASTCSVYYTAQPEGDLNLSIMTENSPVAPSANYSRAKRLAEMELLRLAERYQNFCPIIVRKGTIFGLAPRMRFDLVLNAFTLDAWKKRALRVHGHGEVWRPLLHVRDAVEAYVYLLWTPVESSRGEIFNLVHKNYRILELAHWVAEVLDEYRGVRVIVQRDRLLQHADRSYYVQGRKITSRLGFRPERGTKEAVLAMWDALERGDFGSDPEQNESYFNIRSLRTRLIDEIDLGTGPVDGPVIALTERPDA